MSGLIFEFEDTFPYEGNLKPLRGTNVYSGVQLKELLVLMKRFNI